MGILVHQATRVIVQGITGSAAAHHTAVMRAFGTQVVAGVRPKATVREVDGVPVFDTVAAAVRERPADASILFVPARAMRAAAFEALDAGVALVVMVSEHVPMHDAMAVFEHASDCGARVVGPNTPGLIDPAARCKIGFVPSDYYTPGPVGVASRSGTLTYEIVARLTRAGIGQTTCVGVGGDAMVGTTFPEIGRLFQDDPQTEAIVFVGEIGGSMEEEVAALVRERTVSKPVVAYLAGRNAPEGKRMGHAGAIVAGGRGSIRSKLRAFEEAEIPVAEVPAEVPALVRTALGLEHGGQ
ncbi:MAG: succinate--CoA ligase subunit alpha [bacterium]|nr:succinate--CoA ligase subunit alpha [bacterium]